jgi:hypothetical protein
MAAPLRRSVWGSTLHGFGSLEDRVGQVGHAARTLVPGRIEELLPVGRVVAVALLVPSDHVSIEVDCDQIILVEVGLEAARLTNRGQARIGPSSFPIACELVGEIRQWQDGLFERVVVAARAAEPEVRMQRAT